jgi:peptidoglycan hydrolase-like protein with peptidoglycan-binding domain
MKKLFENISIFFRHAGDSLGSAAHSLFSRRPAAHMPAAAKAVKLSPSVTHRSPPVHRSSHRRRVRVRNVRRLILIASAAAVVLALAIALPLLLTANKNEVASAQGGDLPLLPNETQTAAVTLDIPAYAELSISEGVSADVVADVQSRLMELGYMDEDDPDGNYSEVTRTAVEHFQQQAGLSVSGTVDQATMEALISPNAQEYTIALGTKNDDVTDIQDRLYELGYIADKPDGVFGEGTENAVKKFQKLNNLEENGKVNKTVRELLYSEDAVSNAYSYGEESPEILEFQNKLKDLGYLTSTPDGKFGADTKAAVKRFQESNGLVADGYIGPATKEALMSGDAQSNALTIGAEGADVENVQEMLKKLGYMSKVTGYYGSTTDSAVRSFQHNNGLSVDGKIGRKTMAVLTSGKAKKSTGVNITGANASSFVSVAKSKLGCKYVRGAKGPDKFDCSGFVYWCLNKVGVKQGYMTSHGWANSSKYTKIDSISSLKKGDIIVFSGHVAICIGGGMMIDASSSNGKVVKRSCTSSWCKRMFICGFRVF